MAMLNNQMVYNVGKTIINHPFENGVQNLFMVNWGMVSSCFTHINLKYY